MKNKIPKGKITMTITLGLVCFVFTMIMFMQFRTVEETDIASIENMREDELRTEIANWKTKYEEANKSLEETISKINEYESKMENNQEATEVLRNELKEANDLLGKNDVEGPGIVVTLTDTEDVPIRAFDITKLINELRLAGAEAISINDVRILAMSELTDVNNMYIVINGIRLIGPNYVVKAIGNPSYLESGLTNKQYGYMENYAKAENITVKVERENKLNILKYDGEMSLKYIYE